MLVINGTSWEVVEREGLSSIHCRRPGASCQRVSSRRQHRMQEGGAFVTTPSGTSVRYNPPPNWPAPPTGWSPPPGWSPDPAWGPPPEGWQFWESYPAAPAPPWGAQTAPTPGIPWYRQGPKWAYAAIGTAVIGIIIADLVPGVAGHVIALVVWVAAGVICFRPAISKAKSRLRTGARVGLAICACFAVYAGALAVASSGSDASSGNVAGDNGTTAPHCYATANGVEGGSFTIAELGTSDCTAIATATDISLASFGYHATPNTSKGPGSVICEGMVNGNPVTVIATQSDPALCDQLGLSPF